MWWSRPPLFGYRPNCASVLLEVVARAFAVVQVGGLHGSGPERGRNFEQLFYALCARRGLVLSEKAGARSLAGQRSGSGFCHEVDAASGGAQYSTHWELKYLTAAPEKNDFLIFNGKGLDFFQGYHTSALARPIYRFFLTGSNVNDACRQYAAFWGISIIEPDRLPLLLIHEAAIRGGAESLSSADRAAVRKVLPHGFRPLRDAIVDLAMRTKAQQIETGFKVVGDHWVSEVLDIQEQIGTEMFDYLDETQTDWLDDLAQATWDEVGGW